MEGDERMEVLRRHCVMLREHFSSVQIVAVRECEDGQSWQAFHAGEGSYYERVGAVREYLVAAERKFGERE